MASQCTEFSVISGKRCQKHPSRGSTKCFNHSDDRPKCDHIIADTGQQCNGYRVNGSRVCTVHGGSTPVTKAAMRVKLLAMVEPAFQALMDAMEHGDHATSVRAAQIILDRAGFGPKATLSVEDDRQDFSKASPEELLRRTTMLQERLQAAIAGRPTAALEGQLVEPEVVEATAHAEPVVVNETPVLTAKLPTHVEPNAANEYTTEFMEECMNDQYPDNPESDFVAPIRWNHAQT